MIVLDPSGQASPGLTWTLTMETSFAIRQFNKYPNVMDWLPGDILLVQAVNQDWVARKIVAVQTQNYQESHARWQHAAVYMGNRYLAEATTHGVRYSSIDQYVGGHCLKLRRNPLLTSDERWLVAIEAGVRLRASYSFLDIIRIYRNSFQSIADQLKPGTLLQAKSVICSRLCYDAHAALGFPIVPNATKSPVVPAALSLTPKLQDVDLQWCSIA